MPAVSYEHDFELYDKAFSVLLEMDGGYVTHPPSVLVVDRNQLEELAKHGAIPRGQLEQFIVAGILDASLRNRRD